MISGGFHTTVERVYTQVYAVACVGVSYHMSYFTAFQTIPMTAADYLALVEEPDWVKTGATERLPDLCPYCEDVYPVGAVYCISCGKAR